MDNADVEAVAPEMRTRPKHGWTCWFCDETFMTPGAARDHFGSNQLDIPGCQIKVGEERGLLMELRRVQEELTRYRNEDSDKDREFHAMRTKHLVEIREAEQSGYDKGLRDGEAALRRLGKYAGEGECVIDKGYLQNLEASNMRFGVIGGTATDAAQAHWGDKR